MNNYNTEELRRVLKSLFQVTDAAVNEIAAVAIQGLTAGDTDTKLAQRLGQVESIAKTIRVALTTPPQAVVQEEKSLQKPAAGNISAIKAAFGAQLREEEERLAKESADREKAFSKADKEIELARLAAADAGAREKMYSEQTKDSIQKAIEQSAALLNADVKALFKDTDNSVEWPDGVSQDPNVVGIDPTVTTESYDAAIGPDATKAAETILSIEKSINPNDWEHVADNSIPGAGADDWVKSVRAPVEKVVKMFDPDHGSEVLTARGNLLQRALDDIEAILLKFADCTYSDGRRDREAELESAAEDSPEAAYRRGVADGVAHASKKEEKTGRQLNAAGKPVRGKNKPKPYYRFDLLPEPRQKAFIKEAQSLIQKDELVPVRDGRYKLTTFKLAWFIKELVERGATNEQILAVYPAYPIEHIQSAREVMDVAIRLAKAAASEVVPNYEGNEITKDTIPVA